MVTTRSDCVGCETCIGCKNHDEYIVLKCDNCGDETECLYETSIGSLCEECALDALSDPCCDACGASSDQLYHTRIGDVCRSCALKTMNTITMEDI